MQTIPNEISGGHRRRTHSDEFNAQIVAACSAPGVSTAAVAMAQGINPNLARRWVHATERCAGVALPKAAPKSKPSAFVPVQLVAPVSTSFRDTLTAHASPAALAAAPADIRVELRRVSLAVSVSWPSAVAPQCAAWLTELLR